MREVILGKKTIAVDLGRQGENKATTVRFDLPEDWQDPTATVTLRVTRPGETDAYVPEDLTLSGSTLLWQVGSADTDIEGNGRLQVCCVADGRIVKSRAFVTHISPSVGVNNETVDPPAQSVLSAYLEAISTLAAGAETNRSRAEASMEQAAESASEAEGYSATLASRLTVIEAEIRQLVLAAVAEAAETGTLGDIDTGFVTTLKEINSGLAFRVWLGTTAQYNTLAAADLLEPNVLYIKTDDTSASDIREMLENHFMLIMANANEINNLLTATADSTWQPLTISGTGFTAGSTTPQYRKIGSRVYIRGQIIVDMDNVEDVTTVFATLPEGYRPSAAKYRLLAGEGDRMARLYVRTGGGININYFKEYAGATVTGSHWLQLDCEFLTD